jgi:hypothetical protein
MGLQHIVMAGLNKHPSLWKKHNMDSKMKQRIYLGNPCRGRLYHLITKLLKKHRRFCVALWWDRSYGKEEKINKMQDAR